MAIKNTPHPQLHRQSNHRVRFKPRNQRVQHSDTLLPTLYRHNPECYIMVLYRLLRDTTTRETPKKMVNEHLNNFLFSHHNNEHFCYRVPAGVLVKKKSMIYNDDYCFFCHRRILDGRNTKMMEIHLQCCKKANTQEMVIYGE